MNLFKNITINNTRIINNRGYNSKFLLSSFGFNKINHFAFSEKSNMELIKILRAETSK